jgi:GNAT superfamily N-acetyltransferase
MLREIWPDETAESLDRRWWWACDVPPLTVAEDENGALAGMCGSIPFVVGPGNTGTRGSWIVDFFVRAGYQGKGIGKLLVRTIERDYEFLASLNQTDAAYATFSRCGWTPRAMVPFFIHVSPRWYRILSALRRQSHTGLRVEAGPAEFGEEFDALWERVRNRMGVCSIRNRDLLSRRFQDSARPYVLLRATGDTQLLGYFVVRELPPGSIRSFSRYPILMVSDYLAEPNRPDVFAALMYAATEWASAHEVRFILCMSTHPAHQAVLRRNGALSPSTPLVGKRLAKLAVGFTQTATAPTGHWHLTPFDCDLDILFGAKH